MSLARHGPLRASISENTIANNEIVGAVANKRIVVLNVVITVQSGQTMQWKSGTTAISGAMDSSYTAGDAHAGLLVTAIGEALNLDMTAATLIAGHLTYILLT